MVALTDANGSLVERYEYDPYGQPSIFDANDAALSQSAVGNAILFTGRDYDYETGLYYYRARTMHPGLGRFIQHEPLMFVDGMNLYSYVGDMPVVMIDPDGNALISFIQKYSDNFIGLAEGVLFKANEKVWGKVSNIIGSGFQIIGGVAEIVGGVALALTGPGTAGLGFVGAALLITNGVDNIVAGVKSIKCGSPQETWANKGLQKAGWSKKAADWWELGLSLPLSFIGGSFSNSIKTIGGKLFPKTTSVAIKAVPKTVPIKTPKIFPRGNGVFGSNGAGYNGGYWFRRAATRGR